MKTFKYLAIIMAGLFVIAACQKEFSMESGLIGDAATGSLQNSSGNCQPITVHGNFVRDTVLTDSNYVTVQVNVFSPGIYRIFSDTANGFYFKDSGYIAATGLQNFRVKAVGTPLQAQATDFIISFDSSFCRFTINVSDTAPPPPIITPTTSNDYFPTSTASNWTYQEATTGDTNRVTVYPNDSLFAGNTYRSFISTNSTTGPDTSYFRKGNGLYYQYGNFNEFHIYDAVDEKTDFIFLKDNVPEGSTWETPELTATFNSVPGKAKIMFTLVGKDIQTTIGSTTIDSVIQIQRQYMFAPTATGTYQAITTVNFYYGKNIGFIKAEATDPIPIQVNISRWEIYY